MASSPRPSTSSRLSASSATLASTTAWPPTAAKSRTRRSRRLATRGVPRERLAISAPPSLAISILSTRGAMDDGLELGRLIEDHAQRNAEALTQGPRHQARARGGADQGERRQLDA